MRIIDKLNEMDLKVLKTYIECNGKSTSAAKKLFMHRNSVNYHLDQIRKKTNLNPRITMDLFKFIKELEEPSTGI